MAGWLADGNVQFGQWVGAGALLFLILVSVVFPAPLPILVLGGLLGALSALIAMSIVLVYRANQIINFAAGELGALAAVLAVSLIVGPRWPFLPAVGAGLLAALALGGLIEFLVIRRFSKAPRLILTVVTIALAQVLAYGELALPSLFGYNTAPQNFPDPFSFEFRWFPYTFRGAHLLIVIVVPAVCVGLALFFRYTRVGIAVRASAESADRAALLGVPVRRVQTVVWVIAGGLSGLAVLLRAPIVGVSIGSVLGPSLLLRALAAAVIARMEKLSVAFMVAVLLGVVEQAVYFHTGRTLFADPILFAVIIVGLLVQARARDARADDTGRSTWQSVREIRPIPRELRTVPLVRWGVRSLGAAVVAVVLVWPLLLSESSVNLVAVGLIFGIICISLVVLTGWAGQISLGQLAFVAFGAAVAGTLANHGVHFLLCLVAAGAAGAVVAVVIGIPAVRIRGPFLAVATLGFAVACNSYFLNAEFFPWLVPGRYDRVTRPVLFGKFDLENEHTYFYIVLIVLVAVVASASRLRASRTGRTLIATRENARAAQSYGISPVRARLFAFAYSGFVAALAGGLYVFHQHNISTTILDPAQSILLFAVVVIGGAGAIIGGLLGATYLTFLKYSSLTRLLLTQFLLSGVGLLFILLVLRNGLSGLLYDIRDGLLRRIATRKGIVVPSLLADVRVDDTSRPDDDAMALNTQGMDDAVELELIGADE